MVPPLYPHSIPPLYIPISIPKLEKSLIPVVLPHIISHMIPKLSHVTSSLLMVRLISHYIHVYRTIYPSKSRKKCHLETPSHIISHLFSHFQHKIGPLGRWCVLLDFSKLYLDVSEGVSWVKSWATQQNWLCAHVKNPGPSDQDVWNSQNHSGSHQQESRRMSSMLQLLK